MVRTNDGFEIAEADMKLRGPGDIEGTMQSGIGFDLKIANLAKDAPILEMARNMAMDILDKDPRLEMLISCIFVTLIQKNANNTVDKRVEIIFLGK
jgi:ATP-dependent DNA helicase RecG